MLFFYHGLALNFAVKFYFVLWQLKSLKHQFNTVTKFGFHFFFQIVRKDVYTDINIVPILRLKKCNPVGRALPLNAYALDFFKHGSSKAIENENGSVSKSQKYL